MEYILPKYNNRGKEILFWENISRYICNGMKRSTIHIVLLAILFFTACQTLDSYSYGEGWGYHFSRASWEPTHSLPVLEINTVDGKMISSKTDWKDASFTLGDTVMKGKVKGRGNSTWAYPKKPYSIKLSEADTLLGMPSSTRWNLLANYLDPTLMRNAVTFEMARLTSLDWTTQGRYVEVIINGIFMGNYYLTEKVEIGLGRINVESSGNLVCFDDYYDEPYRFKTSRRKLPVNILPASGTSLDQEHFQQIRTLYDTAEAVIYGGGYWQDILDVESFCDWYLLQEISTNTEARWPKSVYMHTGADGKIHAGPAWDYDYSAYRKGVGKLVAKEDLWYDALLKDPAFTAVLKERWALLRPRAEEVVPGFIDSTAEVIGDSARMDREMWPVSLHINGDEQMGFDEATERLKETILDRLVAMDVLIARLP